MLQFFALLIGLSICFDLKSQSVRKPPVIIAHRGDHTVFPENSLKAFEAAIRNGCDYVEVDLRTTADGHLIVMHDATIDRTTNGKGSVRDLRLKDILKFQVFNRDRTAYHPEPVPVCSEVLKICKGRVKIYLDFKEADVQSAWKMIRSNGMDSSLVVYINHQKDYSEWRRVAPQVPLIVSLPDSVRSPRALTEFLEKVDAEILDGDITKYSAEMVVLAHSLKRMVWLDFQHENEGPNDWEKGVDLNIDGFQTDQPRALMKWLSKED